MSMLAAENRANLTDAAGSRSAVSQNDAVQRTAFYLTSRNEPLSAWLHTAKHKYSVDHGVLICAPIGFEQLHSQRSLRHLADATAAQGVPTLRFDWHGTGDSAGSDADSARRTTWHANVRDAVAWMKNQLGCRRVSVVGLRLGAMLAVEALNTDECDNLVLWAPVTCGKAYLRQMQAIEQMAELRPRPADAAAGDVEAAGFLLTEETAQQLAKLNLLQKQLSCLQGFVVGPVDKRLVERFAQFDIPVEQLSLPGFAEMMAEPHYSRVPQETVREIAAWLGKRIVTPSATELTIDFARLGPTQTIMAHSGVATATNPAWGTVRERILRIGGKVDLFGIACEPVEPSEELPTIVMLNSGAASHIGPGRLNVQLARRFAGLGFRCVRFDACGLGESIAANVADENNPYPVTVFRDVELVLQELRTRFGVKRCVLLGLCSGAYAAFQSAAQLADPLLVESILINPLTFYWQDGMPFDASNAEKVMKEHCYFARATNVKKLWKFLRGKTEIGYLDALRLLRRRLRHYVKQLAASGIKADALRPIVAAAHPSEENLPADLARVTAAGRRLALILAENDPGQAVLNYHAPRQAKEMQRNGTLRIATVPNGDHTFSRRAPRETLMQTIAAYLQEHYPASEPATS